VGIICLDRIDDDRLTEFRHISDPDLVTRLGLFVAEGRLVVRRLLSSPGLETRALMVTEPACASLQDVLVDRPGLPVYVVPQAVMNGVTGFNFHRGCLALGVRPAGLDWRTVASGARRLVALERVGNPDNIGSVFRSAGAFGVDGVLLQVDCADPLYRKAIRTSMASSLTIRFAHADPWVDALIQLRAWGWVTIAMTPSPDAPPLREVVVSAQSRPVALLLGHEGEGLTRDTLEACTHRARIPIAAGVDSLNVATAAAIALYEIDPRNSR
jgi:tRNA G18 (ribose-2'-O)-methylase SpoU